MSAREVFWGLYFLLFSSVISLVTLAHPVLCFTDDVLLYRSIHTNTDVSILQRDLDSPSAWSDANGMTFNASKTKIMHISRQQNLSPPTHVLSDTPLTGTSTV